MDSKKQDGMKHIVRVVNTDLDGKKSLLYGLRKIKGISYMYANAILSIIGIDKTKKVGTLTESEVEKLNDVIKNPLEHNMPLWLLNRRKDYESGADKHLISSDLTFQKDNDVKRLMRIKSYRGLRLSWGLPVRGQKTKSNFRRNKGNVTGVKRKK